MKTLFENWRRYLEEQGPPDRAAEKIEIETDVGDEGDDHDIEPPGPEPPGAPGIEPEEEELEEGCGGDVTNLLDDPDGTGHASWRNKKGVASITILDEQ